jgi:hypothetical protein
VGSLDGREYREAMNLADFVDRRADERVLSEDHLPQTLGRPEPMPAPSRTRPRIVAIGATLTGVTLLIGIALIAVGIIEAIASGVGALAIAAVVVGAVLLGTHWGWVHVAEFTGMALERRRDSEVLGRRRQWLEQIKPYTRYDIATSVDDDGSVRIVRARYEPVPAGERGFTFSRRVEREEVHSPEEPGATVAERAELLRREAAADSERERHLYEVAADAYETALLNEDDEQQRRQARRAASEALSEQINAKLREPPLTE